MNMTCKKCGRAITFDDIGMHRKTINRADTEFMCFACLAEHFKVDEAMLREKAEYLKKAGCTLFPAPKEK